MDQIKSNTVARILEEEKKNAESGTQVEKSGQKSLEKCLREKPIVHGRPL